jgi:glycine dehydrogenase subunit 1
MKSIEKNNSRYIPNTEEQQIEMLKEIGVPSFEHLLNSIPEEIRLKSALNIPDGIPEQELFEKIYKLSKRNLDFINFKPLIGAGAYRHYVPEVVKTVLSRSEFYTAYTPYQPEISQGTLQTMFEVQTHLTRLTGMDVVVPSIYDGASATAESALMALRINNKKRVIMSSLVHPHYKETVRTYIEPHGIEIAEAPQREFQLNMEELKKLIDQDTACVIIQNPNFLGGVENIALISDIAHKNGALLIVAVVESLSFAILKSYKETGADIIAGETQSFGMDLNFGGPYNGFIASKESYVRQIPGRIAGKTIDAEGNRAFVMTLRAREQDIRREKATSNLCSNHALNLFAINAYLSLLGKEGLYKLAILNTKSAHYLRNKLLETDKFYRNDYPFFNEFILRAKNNPEIIREKLLEGGFLPPLKVSDFFPSQESELLFAVTEILSKEDLDRAIDIIRSLK